MDVIIYDWFVLMMPSLTDGDVGDVQPSDELLDVYYYKLNQLREILQTVYNYEDAKRVSSKLVQSQHGQIGVGIPVASEISNHYYFVI